MTAAVADRGRRLQHEHGRQWLHREKGDPWAALATGFDDDPGPHVERIRTAGAVVRSSLGVHVTARYAVVARAWAHPGLHPVAPELTLEFAEPAAFPSADSAALSSADPAASLAADPATFPVTERVTRQLAGLGDAFNVVTDVAVPVAGPAAVWAAQARDAAICPQRLADDRTLTGAAPDRHALAAAEGAGLLANTVAALLDTPPAWQRVAADPALAAAAVAETVRYDPPVRLHVRVAHDGVRLDGATIERGERLILLTAAAGRDPAAYPEPGRFRLGRDLRATPVLAAPGPHAVALAEAGIRALAARYPDLRRDGPAVRRRRAPVTGSLLHLPARSGGAK